MLSEVAVQLQHGADRCRPGVGLGALASRATHPLAVVPGQRQHRGRQLKGVRWCPGAAALVHQLAGATAVGGHHRHSAGQRLQHREPEGLTGADRQCRVRNADAGGQRGALGQVTVEAHRCAGGELLQLAAVRPVAVDVEPHRYAVVVECQRGPHGQVRALLPRQPADVHQSQHAVIARLPVVRGPEGVQVDAERLLVQLVAGGLGILRGRPGGAPSW